MDYPFDATDRQLDYYTEFDRRMRRHLRTLVDDTVIEEHRRKPLGQHSDRLDRLLNYFRRGGMAGKLGLHQPDPATPAYHIVRFSGVRGAPSVIEDKAYGSLDEAYHAVFLRRIDDLLGR